MCGSSGRNFRGQNNSGSPFLDQVLRLVPPNPWTNTISTLWPSLGVEMTFKPKGPRSNSLCFRASGFRRSLLDDPTLHSSSSTRFDGVGCGLWLSLKCRVCDDGLRKRGSRLLSRSLRRNAFCMRRLSICRSVKNFQDAFCCSPWYSKFN